MFYGLNGRRLTLTNDGAYELVMAVSVGRWDLATDIAAVLASATAAYPGPPATAG